MNNKHIAVASKLSTCIRALGGAMQAMEDAFHTAQQNGALVFGDYPELIELKLTAIKTQATLLEAILYSSNNTLDLTQNESFNPYNN